MDELENAQREEEAPNVFEGHNMHTERMNPPKDPAKKKSDNLLNLMETIAK